MRIGIITGIACALVPWPLHAGVLTVSPSGPGDFRQIQDAVTAAVDGDVILVKPGEYGSFTVTDKALDIEADGTPCTVTGRIGIASLAAGRTVIVRGLDGLAALGAEPSEGLRLENCDGFVRIEAGVFRGSTESPPLLASAGATITSCASVALHGSRVIGGKNLLNSTLEAGTGLEVSGSAHVTLWNCSCGGEGNYATDGSPGPGATVDGSTLFASGTTFGGGSQYAFTSVCKPGADGLDLVGGAQAQLLDDLFVAGAGSPPVAPLCTSGGPPGLALSAELASGSSYTIVPGAAREFLATSPVREGQTLALSFHGAPLQSAIVLLSLSTQDLPAAGLHGTLLVGTPFVTLTLGTTDALGDFTFSAAVPELGAGVADVALFCQGFFFLSSADKTLGPMAPMLLLDAAF